MRPIQISAVCLFVFVLGSTLQAQNTTGGNQEDPFDTSASDTEFENVDRSGGIGATAQTGAGFSEVSAATGGTNTGARTSGGAGGGFGGFGGGFGGLGNFFSAFNGGGGQASKTAVRTRLRSAMSLPDRRVVQEWRLTGLNVSARLSRYSRHHGRPYRRSRRSGRYGARTPGGSCPCSEPVKSITGFLSLR